MPFTPHSEIKNAIRNLIEEEKKLYGKINKNMAIMTLDIL